MKRSTFVIASLIFLLSLGAVASQKAPFFKSKTVKSEVPHPAFQTVTGQSMDISQFKGKVIVLNFWATWCPPCVAELPALIQLQTTYGNDIQVIGINVDQDTSKVSSFIKSKGITYPIGYATPKLISAYGNIQSIPTTFIIDRNFKIVDTVIGLHDFKQFEKLIKPYI